jgi:fatty acid-binding protein DegV
MSLPSTARGKVQHKLVEWLSQHTAQFDAPYGILDSVDKLANGGAVRRITFGVARHLDATISIWSPNRISIDGQGAFANRISGTYTSADEVITKLSDVILHTS